MIASLKEEKEFSGLPINTIRELPVTLEEIRKAAETDGFIQQIKKQFRLNERNEKGQKCLDFQSTIKRLYTLTGW